MKRRSLLLGVALLLGGIHPLFCQMGKVVTGTGTPLENAAFAGRRMGGVSIGLADDVANLPANPANLASLQKMKIFASLNNVSKHFQVRQDFSPTTKVDWTQGIELGYSAVSLPFQLFAKNAVVAFSYNGRQWDEFDERYFVESDVLPSSVLGKRSGSVRSVSTGLGVQVLRKIRLGVSWTAWSGKNRWEFESIKGVTDDNAQGWHAGIAADLDSFSLGATVAFPHRVLKSSMTSSGQPEVIAEAVQPFNGAVEIGLGFHPRPRWTIGLGYGFQRAFDYDFRERSSFDKLKYPALSRFSAGLEHRLSLKKIHLPLYAGYQLFWRHERLGLSPYLIRMPISDEKNFRHQLLLGMTLEAGSWAIYLDSRWTQDKFKMYLYAPPYS